MVTVRATGSCSTSQPSRRSSSAMKVTSRMVGTSRRTVVPSASSEAADGSSTLFFAPVTRTLPARRAPPTTSKTSTRRIEASGVC